MKVRLVGLLLMIALIVAVPSAVVFAVSEDQMSRPVTYAINQTYLYGERGSTTAHKGLDFLAPDNTPVKAAYGGTVSDFGWDDAEGWWVLINHGGSVYTYYCHLRSDPGVSPPGLVRGNSVSTTTVIGYSGKTGSASSGYHLHFAVRTGGTARDYVKNPEKWLTYLSGTGKIYGSVWNGQGVDPTAWGRVKIVGASKSDTSYGSSWTYDRGTFGFPDAEDWFIADVLGTMSGRTYTLTTSNYGTSKTMWPMVTSLGRTNGDFDVGNSVNDSYEPNNDRASAPTISPSTYYYSYIFNSRDKDHYKVVPATAGSMTITLTNLPQNYNLQLLNSSGTILASSTNTGTTNEQIVYTVTAGTTYYVLVYGATTSTWSIYSTYTLRYTVTPS